MLVIKYGWVKGVEQSSQMKNICIVPEFGTKIDEYEVESTCIKRLTLCRRCEYNRANVWIQCPVLCTAL